MTEYHWTGANQRQFLEALAETGIVAEACAAASMSRRAAYNLRMRREGTAFRMGWDAAQLIARCVVADALMERALLGQTVEVVRDPDAHTTRSTRFDAQLGRALLSRLDRLAEGEARSGTDMALARIVAQDFETFLDLIELGGAGSEVALFVAARDGAEGANQCELAEISADPEPEPEPYYDPAREDLRRADKQGVWFEHETNQLWTNFPPPVGFRGLEEGQFGEDAYCRNLSHEEGRAADAREKAKIAELRTSGEAERDEWFGFAAKAEKGKGGGGRSQG